MMRLLTLEINGFRGIKHARLVFSDHLVFVGPNGSGKNTIIDALSLVFGRQTLVREITEHDFLGSRPQPRDRIRIVATLGGFSSNDPAEHPQWFQKDRAIEKWWNPHTQSVDPARIVDKSELCVQIGYSARFDHEELLVEQKRYFHDDDQVIDPFMEESLAGFPHKLLHEVGFFVLPARRTWSSTISFGSELFRRAVATLGGVPASSVLKQRDELRSPNARLEDDPAIQPLVNKINAQMAQLVPGNPRLQLRVTATDTESLLQALVPHYEREDGASLPASRHGTGLVSLQSLVLLLEIARSRRKQGQSFILALEEPELHVPPGLQRRLIGEATNVSDQVICTTHSPRVAAFFEPQKIQILTRVPQGGRDDMSAVEHLEGRQLAPSSLVSETNSVNQLYTEDRTRLVEALMFNRVLVPEGRSDFEWIRLLLDIVETGERPLHRVESSVPPFGCVIGTVPTRDAAVRATFEKLRTLHQDVLVLVDGDNAGDGYVNDLLGCVPPPIYVVQWPSQWSIEDVVGWVLAADETKLLLEISRRLVREFSSLAHLTSALKNPEGAAGGLKSHYVAHEEIAGAIKKSEASVHRAEVVLETLTRAALGKHEGYRYLDVDHSRSTDSVIVYRVRL
jgi:putative ATP-dependent endonuclease of the OLD family